MNKLLVPVLLIVAVLGIYGSYYFFKQNQESQNLLKNPSEINAVQSKEILAKVEILLILPKDENPTIVSVVDKSKLKGQKFFEKAENGDKVIIFLKAKKAILYRPSSNKIVDVAGVNIEKTQEQATPSGTVKPTVAVEEEVPTPTKKSSITPSPTEKP